jgi:hypothetical protein
LLDLSLDPFGRCTPSRVAVAVAVAMSSVRGEACMACIWRVYIYIYMYMHGVCAVWSVVWRRCCGRSCVVWGATCGCGSRRSAASRACHTARFVSYTQTLARVRVKHTHTPAAVVHHAGRAGLPAPLALSRGRGGGRSHLPAGRLHPQCGELSIWCHRSCKVCSYVTDGPGCEGREGWALHPGRRPCCCCRCQLCASLSPSGRNMNTALS